MEIIKCNFENPNHTKALIQLLNAYSMDNMGIKAPIADDIKKDIVSGLKSHPTSFVLFATDGAEMTGMAVCFIGFSTFRGKKLVNIHDLIVLPTHRGKGVGKLLMKGVEAYAEEIDCCKITLEVRNDNFVAQELYKKEGYIEDNPPMYFWHKDL